MARLSHIPSRRSAPVALSVLVLSALLLSALVLTVTSFSLARAQGEGAIEWSQFQGGAGHPGAVDDGPSPPYEVAWAFSAPEGALSGAVIAGGVAVSVGQSAVYGVDLSTGLEVWRLDRGGGPLSVPAIGVVGDRQVLAYVDTSEDAGTALVRVDLATLEELAPRTRLETTSRSGIAVEGSVAYLGDDDGNVYAIDLSTGALRWSAKEDGEVTATPAVADGRVYVVLRDLDSQRMRLLALDQAGGEVAWSFDPVAGATAASAPAASGGLVVVGMADRSIRAFAAEDGEQVWLALSLSLFSPLTAPAFLPEDLYLADFPGGLYRLDPSDGRRVWGHQLNEQVIRGSPVVVGGTALLGLNDGRLVGIDVESGRLVAEVDTGPGPIGAIAVSHQDVVAVKGGKEAGLVAFVHDPEGALLDVPSPTEIDPRRLFGFAALAFVAVFAVLHVPLRLLSRRLAPADVGAGPALEEDLGVGSPGDEDPEDDG